MSFCDTRVNDQHCSKTGIVGRRFLTSPISFIRVITVDHIPINCEDKEEKADKRPSHVQAWDDNCGWTKLRLFELSSYDTILYIDADCLVVKDVGRLLDIGVTHTNQGLLAAAPDIFPPDKFNAGGKENTFLFASAAPLTRLQSWCCDHPRKCSTR